MKCKARMTDVGEKRELGSLELMLGEMSWVLLERATGEIPEDWSSCCHKTPGNIQGISLDTIDEQTLH